MTMILVFKIVLCSIVMAEQLAYAQDNPKDVWWYRVTRVRDPFQTAQTTCLLQSQPLVTRDDYTYTPGFGGHKVHTRAATWPEARRICEEEGGHLAIINSVAEAKVVTDLWDGIQDISEKTGNGDFAFIGFHDLFQEGEYVTIFGQTLAKAGYSQWAPGKPDNRGATGNPENCGSLRINGGLNDEECSRKNAFICELPMY